MTSLPRARASSLLRSLRFDQFFYFRKSMENDFRMPVRRNCAKRSEARSSVSRVERCESRTRINLRECALLNVDDLGRSPTSTTCDVNDRCETTENRKKKKQAGLIPAATALLFHQIVIKAGFCAKRLRRAAVSEESRNRTRNIASVLHLQVNFNQRELRRARNLLASRTCACLCIREQFCRGNFGDLRASSRRHRRCRRKRARKQLANRRETGFIIRR